MFETSVIRAHAINSGHRYRFLTLSLAMHSCAIAVLVTATVVSTRLPVESPRQMELFRAVQPPPPALGTPDSKPAAPKHTAVPAAAPRTPLTPVAPQVIPEQTVPAASVTPSTVPGTAEVGPSTGPVGLPNGNPLGRGNDESAVGNPPTGAGPLRPGIGEVKAPIILQRVLPDYPRVAVQGRINGSVVLECIIDKTGHIRDAKVVKSSFAAFDQPALDAVQKWVFLPGTLHGEPVDTIFDLTVTFQVR